MTSLRLLFLVTLFLLLGFSLNFGRDLGGDAIPWIASLWLAWLVGVLWVRSRRWS
ncbi:MAG: hypothetical protein IT305_25545 [Chloroflexi bacterium]|nr:hypothetical protein [Chloroflexota bacterium]